MNNLKLWKEIIKDNDIDFEIPIISPQKIQKIDNYFSVVKCLNKEQHQLWRLLKKAIPVLHSRFTSDIHKSMDSEEQIAWNVKKLIEKKGLCNEIKVNLILNT